MTPSARLAAVIDILNALETSNAPADQSLRQWGRANRYAGSKDRAAIAERVFAVLRHRASFAFRMGSETSRAQVIASLLAEGESESEIAALFSGDRYAPPPLTPDEIDAIANAPTNPQPHVTGEYPQWLEPELLRFAGEYLPEEMHALQLRAPIDLRVNTLKATRDEVLSALRAAGYDASPTHFSPLAIRIPAGAKDLEQTDAFTSGQFEFQDEAAQIACILANPMPGERVLDIAAGAGGKSLALAALMNGQGAIVAEDIAANRLARLAPRAERAGVTIVSENGGGGFDLVFVDAPCSGSGTWHRQPEQKWRLTPERLAELHTIQDTLLDTAAARVKPGGRILYATCSILPSENDDRVSAFLTRHPDFTIKDARAAWAESQGSSRPSPGMAEYFRASTLLNETDGFFAAILVHKT